MKFRSRLTRAGTCALGTITSVETEQRVVALTFDDGPDPVWTPKFVDVLEGHGARGTFFMVGNRATEHPEVVARVAEGGHAIGNHTWDHPSLPLLPRWKRLEQIRRCSDALGIHQNRLFRPPFGHQNIWSRLDVGLAGLTVVGWNVMEPDWLDWKGEKLAARIEERVRPGAIVLLHDSLMSAVRPEYFDRQESLLAVKLLLERMRSRYRFVTIPELMKLGRPRRVWWMQAPDHDFLSRQQRGGNLQAHGSSPQTDARQ